MKLTKKQILTALNNAYQTGDKQIIADTRYALGKESLMGFAYAYFSRAMKHATPDFMVKWYEYLEFKDFNFLLLIGFRGSAKSSLARIKVCRDILYRRHKLIGYVCYGTESAREALFDILTWLQTNQLILNDFGNIFEHKIKLAPEKKTQSTFVTKDGVRVNTYSVENTVRGKMHDFERPQCYIIDDIENNKTKKSAVKTKNVKNFLRELITGLDSNPEIVIVSNYITDTGSIAWLEDIADGNAQWKVSRVPIIENNKIVWNEKYVWTNKEREESTQKHLPYSIEALKQTVNADGQKLFEQEMLLEPSDTSSLFFDKNVINEKLRNLKSSNVVINTVGDWRYFFDYPKGVDPLVYYNENIKKTGKKFWGAIGADVSEGFGNDSSVICIIDFINGVQIAEFESNNIQPSTLGLLMVECGKKLNNCILCPERNSIGVSTIDTIVNSGYKNIYVEKSEPTDVVGRSKKKYGWRTTSLSKPKMLFDLNRDFNSGVIDIRSSVLLKEMRYYGSDDIQYKSFDPEASNHFDRVIAVSIAWQMRNAKQGGIA